MADEYLRKLARMNMTRIGYKELRNNAVDLYRLIGERYYERILVASLDYSRIRSAYLGVDKSTKEFQELAKRHTDALVDCALKVFDSSDPECHGELMKLFEQDDLEYIMNMIDDDARMAKKKKKLKS